MKKIALCFFQPYRWQSEPITKTKTLCAIVILSVYFIISALCNSRWSFPYFYLFFSTFTAVLVLVLYAEMRHTSQINGIRALTAKKNGFLVANGKYTQLEQSKLVGTIATIIVATFGVGGVSIYGAISITPTLVLCLLYFSVVVYLSIVGYVQYIFLFVYIILLVRDKANFTKVQHELKEIVPAEINWLYNLTKAVHFYRNIFFTVGTFYTVAFWFYCSSSKFAVSSSHWAYYILWAIIFLAIVITFPVISVIEFRFIKKLVVKVKKAYITEIKVILKNEKNKIQFEVERHILGEVFSSSILQSPNYPITNRLGIAYAMMLAILNLIGSVDIALQMGNRLFLH